MESSTAVSSSVRPREYRRRKKKIKPSPQSTDQQISDQNPSNGENKFSWRSEKTEQIYSSKLIQALKKVRQSNSSSAASQSAPRRGRSVREAADRALAVAAKGRTRWSRAILTNRLKLKFLKSKRPRVGAVASSGGVSATKKPRLGILRGKNFPAVQRKVRVLGRLVPGCRKEALPVILEEATDYISALEPKVYLHCKCGQHARIIDAGMLPNLTVATAMRATITPFGTFVEAIGGGDKTGDLCTHHRCVHKCYPIWNIAAAFCLYEWFVLHACVK